MKWNIFWIVISVFNIALSRVSYENKRFVFIVPSYNNQEYYKKNIDSIVTQEYKNYRVIYIDDCSPDNTGQLVQEYVTTLGMQEKFLITINDNRYGALANIYRAVHTCDDEEICVFLDGDDALMHKNVLNVLSAVYDDASVWLTYGNYQWSDGSRGHCRPIPKEVINQHAYRRFPWVTSHLRSCYAWLFKHIKLKDLLYEGSFYPVAWDLAFMIPLLELSGGRFKSINSALYWYNAQNPLNDFKLYEMKQQHLATVLRHQKAYIPLTEKKIKEKLTQKKVGLMLISQDAPDKLTSCLMQFQELIKQHICRGIAVLYFAYSQEHAQAYQKLFEQLSQIRFFEYRNPFVLLAGLCSYSAISCDYCLVCSDNWKMPELQVIQQAMQILTQTHALIINLGEISIRKTLEQMPNAYIGNNFFAYQLERHPFYIRKDSSWAYLINMSEIMAHILDLYGIQWNLYIQQDTHDELKKQLLLVNEKDII